MLELTMLVDFTTYNQNSLKRTTKIKAQVQFPYFMQSCLHYGNTDG